MRLQAPPTPDWGRGEYERTGEELEPAASIDRFPWADREAVAAQFGRHGTTVEFEEGSIAFTGESPEAFRVTSRYLVGRISRAR